MFLHALHGRLRNQLSDNVTDYLRLKKQEELGPAYMLSAFPRRSRLPVQFLPPFSDLVTEDLRKSAQSVANEYPQIR